MLHRLAVLQSLELRTRQATEDDLSHAEFLLRLLSDEIERRDSKQLDVRIRRASFDGPRSIEDEIIRQRYERGSTIFTSNRAIEEWPPIFGDLLLASAALDRLLHHAHVIEMKGDTFRNPPSGKRTRSFGPKAT